MSEEYVLELHTGENDARCWPVVSLPLFPSFLFLQLFPSFFLARREEKEIKKKANVPVVTQRRKPQEELSWAAACAQGE